MLLVCSSIPPLVVCANSTGGYFLIEAVGVNNSASVNVSGLNITRLGTNTEFNVALLPKLSPGNTTSTDSSNSDGWDWWVWALIGGAGLILIVLLILLAVFYSDIKKTWQGYNKMESQVNQCKDKKVIEVTLVQPCGPYV